MSTIDVRASIVSFIKQCLLISLLTVVMSGVLNAGEPYHWPIDAPTNVTSTLGEYRGDHLHNGIDFSTRKMRERPVFAVDTGVVERVFFDGDRYGKTLVIRHEDGRRSWYSHLESINSEIRSQLEEPVRPGLDLETERSIQIQRGMRVAHAGQTGRGGLHLHFTLETADGDFIDPLGRFSPSLPYRGRPSIHDLHVVPVGDGAWIDGEPGRGVYEEWPRRRIPVWGRIGLSVTLWNRHPGTGNRSLPRAVVLRRDGDTVLHRQFERLSPEQQQRGVYRVFDGNRTNLSPTQFTLNLTPEAKDGSWEGLLFREEGRTGELTVVVHSRNGERRERVISYDVVPPPVPFPWFTPPSEREDGLSYDHLTSIQPASSEFLVATLKGRQAALRQFSPPQFKRPPVAPELDLKTDWQFNRIRVSLSVDGTWDGWPTFSIRQDTYVERPSLIQVNTGQFVTWWEPSLDREGWHEIRASIRGENGRDTVSKRIYLQALRPEREGAAVSLDGQYSLFGPGEGLLFGTYVRFRERGDLPAPRAGLSEVNPPREITPIHLQSDREMVLSAAFADTVVGASHVGLYRWNPVQRRWEPLTHERSMGQGTRETHVHQTGTFGFFRDEKAPEIRSVKRADSTTIRIRWQEQGSGLRRSGISITIDDHPVGFRWSRSNQWITVSIPAGTSLSERPLRVELEDRAGRRGTWEGVINQL